MKYWTTLLFVVISLTLFGAYASGPVTGGEFLLALLPGVIGYHIDSRWNTYKAQLTITGKRF